MRLVRSNVSCLKSPVNEKDVSGTSIRRVKSGNCKSPLFSSNNFHSFLKTAVNITKILHVTSSNGCFSASHLPWLYMLYSWSHVFHLVFKTSFYLHFNCCSFSVTLLISPLLPKVSITLNALVPVFSSMTSWWLHSCQKGLNIMLFSNLFSNARFYYEPCTRHLHFTERDIPRTLLFLIDSPSNPLGNPGELTLPLECLQNLTTSLCLYCHFHGPNRHHHSPLDYFNRLLP